MSLKSIIAALAIVGSSSAAMAAPVVTYTRAATVREAPHYVTPTTVRRSPPIIADDDCNNTGLGTDLSVYHGAVGTKVGFGWTALTQPTRIDRGREFITIGKEHGRFTTVKLENVRGTSNITQVLINFANGTSQVVKLNQRLSAANPCIEINLDGNKRAISGIVVYGASWSRSAYQILAA